MMFDARTLLLNVTNNSKIGHLTNDSRQVTKGSAFFAYPGSGSDGRLYIGQAIDAGASAIFWEANNYQWPYHKWSVYNQPVDELKYKLGYFADAFYHSPSSKMPVIAVTGTNGKTSIVHLIAQLLSTATNKVGTIGTLGAGQWANLQPLDNTTPDSIRLHQIFQQFATDKFSAAVIEASSHGIAQGRINGVNITTAVFANAQTDHLDFHKHLNGYWRSKAKLFDVPSLQSGVLNADDQYCASLAAQLKLKKRIPIYTYGKTGDDLRIVSIKNHQQGSVINIDGCMGKKQIFLNFIGQYNIDNFLAAMLTSYLHGVTIDTVEELSATLTLPMGRMQKISSQPDVYVDFAHTPDAMRAILKAVRKENSDLWVVFGCGGNRDESKRHKMGAIAKQYANHIIVTDDNPRDEDPAAIRNAIIQAVPHADNIADREKAISTAIKNAKANDVILILGKGHEQSQIIQGKQLPFSDALIAQQQIKIVSCT